MAYVQLVGVEAGNASFCVVGGGPNDKFSFVGATCDMGVPANALMETAQASVSEGLNAVVFCYHNIFPNRGVTEKSLLPFLFWQDGSVVRGGINLHSSYVTRVTAKDLGRFRPFSVTGTAIVIIHQDGDKKVRYVTDDCVPAEEGWERKLVSVQTMLRYICHKAEMADLEEDATALADHENAVACLKALLTDMQETLRGLRQVAADRLAELVAIAPVLRKMRFKNWVFYLRYGLGHRAEAEAAMKIVDNAIEKYNA